MCTRRESNNCSQGTWGVLRHHAVKPMMAILGVMRRCQLGIELPHDPALHIHQLPAQHIHLLTAYSTVTLTGHLLEDSYVAPGVPSYAPGHCIWFQEIPVPLCALPCCDDACLPLPCVLQCWAWSCLRTPGHQASPKGTSPAHGLKSREGASTALLDWCV
jgi:hypothetical protein